MSVTAPEGHNTMPATIAPVSLSQASHPAQNAPEPSQPHEDAPMEAEAEASESSDDQDIAGEHDAPKVVEALIEDVSSEEQVESHHSVEEHPVASQAEHIAVPVQHLTPAGSPIKS